MVLCKIKQYNLTYKHYLQYLQLHAVGLVFSGANDILEVIDLSWNQIRGKGAIAVAKGIGVSRDKVKSFHFCAGVVSCALVNSFF